MPIVYNGCRFGITKVFPQTKVFQDGYNIVFTFSFNLFSSQVLTQMSIVWGKDLDFTSAIVLAFSSNYSTLTNSKESVNATRNI